MLAWLPSALVQWEQAGEQTSGQSRIWDYTQGVAEERCTLSPTLLLILVQSPCGVGAPVDRCQCRCGLGCLPRKHLLCSVGVGQTLTIHFPAVSCIYLSRASRPVTLGSVSLQRPAPVDSSDLDLQWPSVVEFWFAFGLILLSGERSLLMGMPVGHAGILHWSCWCLP